MEMRQRLAQLLSGDMHVPANGRRRRFQKLRDLRDRVAVQLEQPHYKLPARGQQGELATEAGEDFAPFRCFGGWLLGVVNVVMQRLRDTKRPGNRQIEFAIYDGP